VPDNSLETDLTGYHMYGVVCNRGRS
jgi:hypothetical protein